MEYVMYVVFGFWYLCSVQELAVAISYLVRRDPAPLRPVSYYVATFAFGVAVTSVLLLLYYSGRVDPWPTIIIGTVIFLAEAIYSAWSKGVLIRGRSE